MWFLNKILIFFSLLVASVTLNPAVANNDLVVEKSWVREGPPSATVLAGYMTIKNVSDRAYTLTQVTSSQFETAEMHESLEENGMARMRKHEHLTLLPHSELVFTPNGFHLMLMDPYKPIRAGTEVELVLKFQDLITITVHAPVKRVID